MLGKIVNGKLKTGLPTSGVLKNGVTVSNYHLLSAEVLAAEGWKEIEEVMPAYDVTSQYLSVGSVDEHADKIIVTYIANTIARYVSVEEPQTTIAELDAEVVELTYQNILLELGVS